MFVALSVLCGVYVLHYEPKLLDNLAPAIVDAGADRGHGRPGGDCLGATTLRAELVPLVVFGMTLSIAYHRELALLFSAAAALVDRRGHRARA